MKKAIIILLLFALQLCASAQSPRYYCNASGTGNYFPFGSPGGNGSRVQLLYHPEDFQSFPSEGIIHNIYFKSYEGPGFNGVNSYADFSIKMGATSLQEFPPNTVQFCNTLTPVFFKELYTLNFQRGEWIGPISLDQPFHFEAGKNLIVELSVRNASSIKYVGFTVFSQQRRTWGDNKSLHVIGSDGGLYAIGFDITMPAPLSAKTDEPILQPTPSKNEGRDAALAVVGGNSRVGVSEEKQASIASEKQKAGFTTSGKRQPLIDKLFLLSTGLLGLLCLGVMLPFLPKTTKYALWAHNNPRKTKWLLFGSQLVTSVAGFLLGKHLFDQGIATSDVTTNALFAAATVGTLMYPSRKAKTRNIWKRYQRQKLATLLVAISGFGLATNAGNKNAADRNFMPIVSTAMSFANDHYYEQPLIQETFMSAGIEKERPISHGWAIALRIIATVLLVLILVAVAIGSCVLVCIEQPVWACVLLFGGGGGAIFGYIRALQALNDADPRPQRRRHGYN